MRYCYNCNRITAGEPLFCNFCGRSYNVKLCPRRHVNPRGAEACSQCGSRDLSTPQPKVPFWVPILEFALSLVPGLVLGAVSLAGIALVVNQIAQRPDMILALFFLFCALGVLWWAWSQIPAWFRRRIHEMLKRRRNGDERRGH